MSYSEENGQVILTMTGDDFDFLMLALAGAIDTFGVERMVLFANRLNEGNPRYTPYDLTSPPATKS
jgi:hypothetical protein